MFNEENREMKLKEVEEKEKNLDLKLFVHNAQNEALKEEVRRAEQKYQNNIDQIKDLEKQLDEVKSYKRILTIGKK